MILKDELSISRMIIISIFLDFFSSYYIILHRVTVRKPAVYSYIAREFLPVTSILGAVRSINVFT